MQLIRDLRPWFEHRRLTPFAIGVALLLTAPSLWTGWVMDDSYTRAAFAKEPPAVSLFPSKMRIFSFMNGDAERARELIDLGIVPWWTEPEVRLNFWRPIAVRTHWLDYQLWPDVKR